MPGVEGCVFHLISDDLKLFKPTSAIPADVEPTSCLGSDEPGDGLGQRSVEKVSLIGKLPGDDTHDARSGLRCADHCEPSRGG
ncbi:MAG: hypothetical protein ACI8V4_000958, partial [Ilumatobacter sp.]